MMAHAGLTGWQRYAARTMTADEARFDAALTICVMRYLSDLHVGRINPQHLGFEFDVSQKKLNLPEFVRERLADGSDLREEVAAVAPPFPGYQRLRDALQHYMELEKSADAKKIDDPGRLSPGSRYTDIATLAGLLRLLGDLPESATIPPDERIYQGALVDAVKHFQQRHGLRPTGELDSETVAEMNVPLSDRVEQMRMAIGKISLAALRVQTAADCRQYSGIPPVRLQRRK